MIKFSLDVNGFAKNLENHILKALAQKLTLVLRQASAGIQIGIREMCAKLIEDTGAYESLMGEELLGELGVPDVRQRMDKILQTISDNVTVDVIPIQTKGTQLAGGLNIGILTVAFDEILTLSEAEYTTDKGEVIPWLDWLIVQGDRIIIVGYDVSFDSPNISIYSRTGLAVMVKGSGWRVPPEYSGILSNNFLTRAFDAPGVENAIAKLIEQEMQRRL